jgi:hypothetical protein
MDDGSIGLLHEIRGDSDYIVALKKLRDVIIAFSPISSHKSNVIFFSYFNKVICFHNEFLIHLTCQAPFGGEIDEDVMAFL